MNSHATDDHSRGRSAVFEVKESSPEAYKGPERRRKHRRIRQDRREEMRFEPTKSDRRAEAGRREDDKQPTFW